jgi:hypothetical protein
MKKAREKILVSIAGRVTVFLYLFSVFILLLYIQGNFQDFLDQSLISLLTIYKYTALIFTAAAVSYVYLLISGGRGSGRNIGVRIFLAAVGIALSAAGFLITAIISAAMGPVI